MRKKYPIDSGKFRAYVEKTLRRFPFIRWDRFTFASQKGMDLRGVGIYGWIDRTKDAYKDFILIEIWEDGDINYDTSSADESLRIYKILNYGDGKGHQNCKRVENFFRVKNSIKLKKKK